MSDKKIEIYVGDMQEQYEEALVVLAKSEGNEDANGRKLIAEAEEKVARWLLVDKYRQIITELADEQSAFDYDNDIMSEVDKARKAKRRELIELGELEGETK